jgi:hypothetical protein
LRVTSRGLGDVYKRQHLSQMAAREFKSPVAFSSAPYPPINTRY